MSGDNSDQSVSQSFSHSVNSGGCPTFSDVRNSVVDVFTLFEQNLSDCTDISLFITVCCLSLLCIGKLANCGNT